MVLSCSIGFAQAFWESADLTHVSCVVAQSSKFEVSVTQGPRSAQHMACCAFLSRPCQVLIWPARVQLLDNERNSVFWLPVPLFAWSFTASLWASLLHCRERFLLLLYRVHQAMAVHTLEACNAGMVCCSPDSPTLLGRLSTCSTGRDWACMCKHC